MRILLVVNPGARGVTDSVAERTVRRWSADHEVQVARSVGAGARAQLAALLEAQGAEGAEGAFDAVVVLGGDGMVNDVANVLADRRSDATLVALPAGTTNVVARSQGLPRQLEAASEAALAALEAGRTARRGWGRLNGRGFLANAGIGLDGAVVSRVESRPARKARLGHLWFAAAAGREVWGELHHVRLHEVLDPPPDGTGASSFWVLALASHPYTYAGSRPLRLLAPGGRCDDGLWLGCFAPMSLAHLTRLGLRALLTSRGITRASGVVWRKIATTATFSTEAPVRAQTDGEPLAPANTFTLSWEPDALRMLQPLPSPAPRRRALGRS